MTQQEWELEGRMHARRAQNATWEIAWWLVDGQARHYDVGFARASAILGLAADTCHGYHRVGKAFPRGKAHPDLSFSAHRELLREPDEALRAIVLSQAIEHGWGQDDIVRHFEQHPPSSREYAGQGRPAGRANKAPYNRKYYEPVQVKCPHCERVFPVKGNKVGGPRAVVAEVAS